MPTSQDDITSGREPAPEHQPAPEGSPPTQRDAGRDEHGRFAPKAKDPEPAPQAEGDQPQGQEQRQPGTVPKQALEAERRKRQERDDELATLRRQVAAIEQRAFQPQQPAAPPAPPKPAPQIFEDPDGWGSHLVRQAVDPVREEFTAYKLAMSKQFATQQHGEETVNAAVQGVLSLRQTNPAEFQRLEALAERSVDPVGDLVRWHKQQRTVQEVGEDPEAYFQRRLAEHLASQAQAGAAANDPPQPAGKAPLPTSFASARSGGPRGGPEYSGPRPLSEMTRRG